LPEQPRVSVVVVSYNTRADLRRCLDHLERSREPVEIIVVDNASRDGSAAEARRPGVRLFPSPVNQGFAAANNLGARQARGRLLLLLNPDAFVEPDSIGRLADLLDARPDLAGTAPRLVGLDGQTQRTCRRLPTVRDALFELAGLSRLFPGSAFFNRWKMGGFDHDETREVEQVFASCWLLRRADFLHLGGFDTRFPIFFNDVDLARRLDAAVGPTLYEPSIAVTHVGGSSVRRVRARSVLNSHRAFYRYLAKYGRSFAPLRWLTGLLLALTAPLRVLAADLR
jgi:hypothetical protein